MNEQDKRTQDNGADAPANPCRSGRRRHRGLGAVTLLVAGGLFGAGLVTAFGVAAHSDRGGYGMGGMEMEGPRHGAHHGGDRDKHGERMKRRADYLLDEVDATPEQREKVHALLEDMFAQMRDMRAGHEQGRDGMIAALTAPEVDRAALERMRQQRVGDMESRSKLMVEGLAGIADVLSPEQRAEIAEHLRKHGRRH